MFIIKMNAMQSCPIMTFQIPCIFYILHKYLTNQQLSQYPNLYHYQLIQQTMFCLFQKNWSHISFIDSIKKFFMKKYMATFMVFGLLLLQFISFIYTSIVMLQSNSYVKYRKIRKLKLNVKQRNRRALRRKESKRKERLYLPRENTRKPL